jgi:hypothetical protein
MLSGRTKKIRKEWERIFLVYADNVNTVGEDTNTINTEGY